MDLSADGRSVSFSSNAANLVPDDANGTVTDIFVHGPAQRPTGPGAGDTERRGA
jgi:hypothetical protein